MTSSTSRILLVTRNFPPLLGGMERLNHHIFQELEKEHEVYLIGPNDCGKYVTHPKRIIACPSTPVFAFLAYATFQAMRLARKHRPALIIAGSGVNALPAWFAACLSGTPWIVYLHGLDLVVNHFVYQRIFLPVIRRANAWLVNSHSTARLAVAAGLDANRLQILHPGVEIPEVLPSDAAIQLWRDKYSFDNRLLLLSVGRLTRRKGLREFVLHALPSILATHPDALLVVIGAEPRSALTSATVGVDALTKAAQQIDAEENLKILGTLSDEELGLAYRAASVLIFPVLDIPGDVEGFGMVAIEAAAYGLPTVAFAVGGVSDAISDGYSGCLIPTGDYSCMANRVIEYLQGRPDATFASCRNFASGFSWLKFGVALRKFCQKWLDLSGISSKTCS